jgi:hypothetical protein
MVRRSSELLNDAEESLTIDPPTMRETCNVRQTLDELGTARCPLCRGVLVARLSRSGPVFFCACLREARKRAS